VPGVGEQGQRVRDDATGDLRQEKGGGNREREAEAPHLVARIAGRVMVVVIVRAVMVVTVIVRDGRLLVRSGRINPWWVATRSYRSIRQLQRALVVAVVWRTFAA
jgi:hypothetical protein